MVIIRSPLLDTLPELPLRAHLGVLAWLGEAEEEAEDVMDGMELLLFVLAELFVELVN